MFHLFLLFYLLLLCLYFHMVYTFCCLFPLSPTFLLLILHLYKVLLLQCFQLVLLLFLVIHLFLHFLLIIYQKGLLEAFFYQIHLLLLHYYLRMSLLFLRLNLFQFQRLFSLILFLLQIQLIHLVGFAILNNTYK